MNTIPDGTYDDPDSGERYQFEGGDHIARWAVADSDLEPFGSYPPLPDFKSVHLVNLGADPRVCYVSEHGLIVLRSPRRLREQEYLERTICLESDAAGWLRRVLEQLLPAALEKEARLLSEAERESA